jgi:intracellular multiplication protein IcmK
LKELYQADMRFNFRNSKYTFLALGLIFGMSCADYAYGQKEDPLATWRKSAGSANKNQSTTQTNTPLPTPGGFQETGDGTQPQFSMDDLDEDMQLKMKERQKEIEELTREAAFDAALNTLMPMTPEEISRLLETFRENREAAEQRPGGIPEPEVVVKEVPLDPSARPPMIKVSPGYVTSVNIMDITGKPWPIETLSWGGEFEVVNPGNGGHIIRITPMKAHAVGNLSMKLINLDTPITFSMHSQIESVHYRFDARIPEYGPYADMPIIDTGVTLTAGGNASISTVLQGVIPNGAKKLKVEGVDGRTTAYRHNGQTMVRTPLTLLSPGWSESAKSADGMTVYVVHNTPVLLLSDNGKMMRATLSESEVQ